MPKPGWVAAICAAGVSATIAIASTAARRTARNEIGRCRLAELIEAANREITK